MADEEAEVLFGRRVRQLPVQQGLKQEDFTHAVKLDRSYFGSVERGISLENIALTAKGLGVSPAELLMFEKLETVKPDAPTKPAKNSTTRRRGVESP
jgi:transcriptional regulator with XRE-family HTH domain